MKCNLGYQEHKYDIEVNTNVTWLMKVSSQMYQIDLLYILYKPLNATFEFGMQIEDMKTHESYCLLCSLFADMFIDLKSPSP